MKLIVLVLAGVMLCACNKKESSSAAGQSSSVPSDNAPAPAAATKPEPSTLETAVDGFTGRGAVNAGRRAQQKIRAVSGERDAEMKEVENFGK